MGTKICQQARSLGKVIQQVFLERDAHWLAPPPMVDPTPPRVPEPARAPAAGSKLAPSLRDGKALCRAWQNNRCPEQHARNCAEGEHLCAHLLKSGGVCGNPGHIGSKCNNKQRR